MQLGVNTFGLREELHADLGGTVKKLRDVGYTSLEICGLFDEQNERVAKAIGDMEENGGPMAKSANRAAWTAEQAIAYLPRIREGGLLVTSCHLFHPALYDGRLTDMVPKVLRFAETTGITHYVVSYMLRTRAECDRFLPELSAAALVMRKNGLVFSYHNHGQELEAWEDGDCALDYLMAHTGPELTLQPDIGWMKWAGADADEKLQKWAGRIVSVHFKDVKKGIDPKTTPQPFTAVGLGCADTAAGMAIAKRRMAEGALIEEGCIIDQDDSDHDMMDDLRIGRETLLSLL